MSSDLIININVARGLARSSKVGNCANSGAELSALYKKVKKVMKRYKKELHRAQNGKKTIEKERFSLRGEFCGAVNRIIMAKNELFGTLGEIISLRTTFARELIAHYKKEKLRLAIRRKSYED